MNRITTILCFLFLGLSGFLANAQTVSPLIVEYQAKGEGKIELSNNTLTPLVVVLEPKSFSITPDGTGIYRPLDSWIHVELSSMNVKLQPKQSYTVFYKANSDKLPAWFTVYCAFSSQQRGPGVNFRIMLPHTVYLYQKRPLPKESIELSHVVFDQQKNKLSFDIQNEGTAYGRVRSETVSAGRESMDLGGFPLLPGNPRHVEATWTGKQPPRQVRVHFDDFDVEKPVEAAPLAGNPPAQPHVDQLSAGPS
jgi:hypothetical protein